MEGLRFSIRLIEIPPLPPPIFGGFSVSIRRLLLSERGGK